MNMLRNKKVLAILAVAAVVALAASFVAQRDSATEEADNGSKLSESDKKFFAEKDEAKEKSLNNVLGSITHVYAVKNLEFPEASEQGWADLLETVPVTESFFDPYIEDQIYQFAKGENPEYGEIQYGPGKACNDKAKDKTFKRGYGRKSLALRAKFSDGYRCVNNFQG